MRGHKSDLVLLDEAKELVPYGPSPLLGVMRDLFFLKKMEEFNLQFWMSQPSPFTSERVAPAAGEREYVEQQAEEGNVQLSTQVER